MRGETMPEPSVQQHLLLPLLKAAESSNPKEAIELLVSTARSDDGRSYLASKNLLPDVLLFVESIPCREYLLLSLRLLRNLCAGEMSNQNSFIEFNGAAIISAVLISMALDSDPDCALIRMGLQVLANVSLAGVEHQRAIWDEFFPEAFTCLGKVRRRESCDPLCMILYTCFDGTPGLVAQLVEEEGFPILTEVLRTASSVGFDEDWLKLVLSRICLDENLFHSIFPRLHNIDDPRDKAIVGSGSSFSVGQAYLLRIVSDILSERLKEITVLSEFALCVLGIFKGAAEVPEHVSEGKTSLPTGSTSIDVLGYSTVILKYVCAGGFNENLEDVVSVLLSNGLLEMLLCLLRDLEPPSTIGKAMRGSEEASTSYSGKPCPYIGFRRDIVGVIGNCTFKRKSVQDKIRQENGVLLLLQQCVTDDDNPFLREWGIWAVKNLLEGNAENQEAVAGLEVQGTVQMPELEGLGLKVEVDQKSGRARLVNTTSEYVP